MDFSMVSMSVTVTLPSGPQPSPTMAKFLSSSQPMAPAPTCRGHVGTRGDVARGEPQGWGHGTRGIMGLGTGGDRAQGGPRSWGRVGMRGDRGEDRWGHNRMWLRDWGQVGTQQEVAHGVGDRSRGGLAGWGHVVGKGSGGGDTLGHSNRLGDIEVTQRNDQETPEDARGHLRDTRGGRGDTW